MFYGTHSNSIKYYLWFSNIEFLAWKRLKRLNPFSFSWKRIFLKEREREREREIGYSMQWNLIAITEWGGTKLVPAGNKVLLIEKTVKKQKMKKSKKKKMKKFQQSFRSSSLFKLRKSSFV